MTAIGNDAANEDLSGSLTEGGAADEFLKRWMPPDEKADAEKPSGSEGKVKETEDTDAEETEAEDAEKPSKEADTEEAEDDKAKRKYAEDDGIYVKVKVGDEEHEVPVKDLKRLFGQEASLTKKSQEVAEHRKTLDAELAKTTASTAALLERARARFEPYSKLDFNLLAKDLDNDQYTALRNETQAAFEEVQFLEQHLGGFMKAIEEKNGAELVNTARETIKVLSGPADKGGIEGWNEKLYDDIRSYAVTEGIPAETVNRLVDPWAIRILHNAMLYKRGASTVVTEKVNKTPKRVIKTTDSPAVSRGNNAGDKTKAMEKLRRTGSTDDAANAFLAGWKADDA